MDTKKVLITGGAGFIGFHFVKKMLHEGYEVIGLDNLNDYYTPQLKFARLQELGIPQAMVVNNTKVKSNKHDKFHFIKQDFTDFDKLENLFETERFDYVIHLGAQAGVRYSLENPSQYIQSNIVGFAHVLECCRHHQIKHLVYASSSSVYGNNNKVPFSETNRVDYPVSLYAATKKSNELMAHTYSYLYQLPTTGLRFFTVYGPWGRPDMSPILFAKAIQNGQPIKVFNRGDMLRDFTYIDDIIDGAYKVLQHIPNADASVPFYNLYNIGHSSPVQLMDFIAAIENSIGKKAVKEFYPMQPGDVYQTYADIRHLCQDVAYCPQVELQEGVQKFMDWYTKQNIV
ncbi:MAG: NAD-dependent epimerase/dehydratase family protein [Petrimonas sp.]|jgi:UDP-glucuronate 4-epimerase|nr:NAD-dependent epimerase/dehydratase family protein [Petrimonas sp.]